jgi:hypothetical protein
MRHTETATWFVEGSTLSEWKSSGPSSLLWVHGKRQSYNPYAFAGIDGLTLDSWRRKERFLVCQSFNI